MAETQSPNAGNAKPPLNVIPTLFFGIGGTGKEVLMRLRRRILNNVWGPAESGIRVGSIEDFPAAQFLHFDLDSSEVEQGVNAATDRLFQSVKFKKEERLVLPFALEKYIRNDEELGRYPHIKSWFPLPPKKLRDLGIDVSNGAGQIRSLSRLYFFDHFEEIKGAIESRIRRLTNTNDTRTQLARLKLELEPKHVRVVMVGSLAGGTGSGSFLDLGFLAGCLLREAAVDSAVVDSVLFLPSGYANAATNKVKTEANGYAALMELEAVLRGDLQLVDRWVRNGEEMSRSQFWPGVPFNSIYFVDTANLAGAGTGDVKELYEMVADILAEDFSAAAFAAEKRSVESNKKQHKLYPYEVDIGPGYGKFSPKFQRKYSAFGQSTLDTAGRAHEFVQIDRLTQRLLTAFFGLASEDPNDNRATDKLRDEFMRESLLLAEDLYQDFPTRFAAREPDAKWLQPMREFALTKSLLNGTTGSLVERMRRRANDGFERFKGEEHEHWPSRVEVLFKEVEADLREGVNSKGLYEKELRGEISARLFGELKAGLRSRLYGYASNREHGGLIFAKSLVEQSRDRLINETTGVFVALRANAQRYRDLAEHLRSVELQALMDNLRQTKPGMFSKKRDLAEQVLQDLRDTAGYAWEYSLRQIACEQAVAVLRRVVDEVFGTVESGAGFVGELDRRVGLIRREAEMIDNQTTQLEVDLGKRHQMYRVLDTPEEIRDVQVDTATARAWAMDSLEKFGGIERLFEKIEDDDERDRMVGELRQRAAAEVRRANPPSESPDDDPLFKALSDLRDRGELKPLFSDLIRGALPWISANFTVGGFRTRPDYFSLFIGVRHSPAFQQRFGADLASAMPPGYPEVANAFKESAHPGRLVVYCELTGFPATCIAPINSWYQSYKDEQKRLPLHIVRQITRLVHPREIIGELPQLAADFKLYLKAVMLGELRREVDAYDPDTVRYRFNFNQGRKGPPDWRGIGDERNVRLTGLDMEERQAIAARVNLLCGQVTAEQAAAMWALAQWHQVHAYPMREVATEVGPVQLTVDAKRLRAYAKTVMEDEGRDGARRTRGWTGTRTGCTPAQFARRCAGRVGPGMGRCAAHRRRLVPAEWCAHGARATGRR